MSSRYKAPNYNTVMEYASSIVEGRKVACVETIQMCQRFLDDLNNPMYDFKPKNAEFVIGIIEKTFVHQKGEDMQGRPLRGRPFLLEPWQKFIVYNLLGFCHKGTILRRFKEAFIMVPRKNGKALSLDTPIPTPEGWKKMEELQEGDIVFDDKGKPTKILVTSDIFYNHDCYKVTFEDGEEIIADAEHIWRVMTKESRRAFKRKCKRTEWGYKSEYRENKGYYDITTEEMAKDFYRKRKDGKGIEYK